MWRWRFTDNRGKMYQYSIIQWIFLFYFYCFCGWCFESAYVSLKTRHWTNRGFLHGPFLPLYGSGATMMLVVSMPFQDNILLTYLAGCVGATVLEYVTGVTMEALFKVRYWDYSYKKFQFQGHICLSSTLAWGGCTILTTEVLQKLVEQVLLAIPGQVLTVTTYVLTAVIFADFSLSFKAALDLRDVLIKLEKARQELGYMQKRLDVVIALTAEEMEQKVAEYKESLRQHRESITEALGETKENLVGAIEGARESIAGVIGETKENLDEAILRARESAGDILEEKRETPSEDPAEDSSGDLLQMIVEWMEEWQMQENGKQPEAAAQQAEGVKAESAQTKSVQAEGVRMENVQAKSVQAENAQTESARTESVQAENVRAESVQTEGLLGESMQAEDLRQAGAPMDGAWGDGLQESQLPDSGQIREGILKKLVGKQKEILHRRTDLVRYSARQIRGILRANPTMASHAFHEIFEELKKAAGEKEEE